MKEQDLKNFSNKIVKNQILSNLKVETKGKNTELKPAL